MLKAVVLLVNNNETAQEVLQPTKFQHFPWRHPEGIWRLTSLMFVTFSTAVQMQIPDLS